MRTHGRISTYANGCRCDDCRRACADYQRSRRHLRQQFVYGDSPKLSGRPAVVEELPWLAEAACKGMDPALFFPVSGAPREAKEACARCGVREACLQYALDTGQHDGLWGGLSARERWRLERAS